MIDERAVPRRSGELGRPCDWVVDFPDGTVAPDAPPGVVELAGVARRLRALTASEFTISGIARTAGVHRTTVHDVLDGAIWIDTSTLARLERAVGQVLWELDGSQ